MLLTNPTPNSGYHNMEWDFMWTNNDLKNLELQNIFV